MPMHILAIDPLAFVMAVPCLLLAGAQLFESMAVRFLMPAARNAVIRERAAYVTDLDEKNAMTGPADVGGAVAYENFQPLLLLRKQDEFRPTYNPHPGAPAEGRPRRVASGKRTWIMPRGSLRAHLSMRYFERDDPLKKHHARASLLALACGNRRREVRRIRVSFLAMRSQISEA
jgi:hypothetical protein